MWSISSRRVELCKKTGNLGFAFSFSPSTQLSGFNAEIFQNPSWAFDNQSWKHWFATAV